MDDKIIKEVINQEKKAEKSVNAKSGALDRRFKKEEDNLRNMQQDEIEKVTSSFEKEKAELIESLKKEFEKKEKENKKLIDSYEKIADSQIDNTIKSVLKVLE